MKWALAAILVIAASLPLRAEEASKREAERLFVAAETAATKPFQAWRSCVRKFVVGTAPSNPEPAKIIVTAGLAVCRQCENTTLDAMARAGESYTWWRDFLATKYLPEIRKSMEEEAIGIKS